MSEEIIDNTQSNIRTRAAVAMAKYMKKRYNNDEEYRKNLLEKKREKYKNKEKKEYHSKYYQDNKEKSINYAKEYYKKLKEYKAIALQLQGLVIKVDTETI